MFDADDDVEQEQDLQCQIHKHPQRAELLKAARVIIWDEIGSQHQKDFAAVFSAMNKFKGKIVLLMGDYMQIAPVVVRGKRCEIVASSIYCSIYRELFQFHTFTHNMRLVGANIEELHYARLLLAIGSGHTVCTVEDAQLMNLYEAGMDNDGGNILAVFGQTIFTDKLPAIEFLYPNGFTTEDATSVCVLASTNELVDQWNLEIQALNPSPSYDLLSYDTFADVDDEHGILADMIDAEVLHRYADVSCPPHILTLKIGDICILMRRVDRVHGMTNNARVEIVHVSPFLIRVRTINTPQPYYASLCKYRFNVRMPYGNSFSMLRTQFPLRLAYSMTFNRSQGQEYRRTLVDMSSDPFCHGHCYVTMSRIRQAAHIAFFTTSKNIVYAETSNMDKDVILIHNVVYDEILTPVI